MDELPYRIALSVGFLLLAVVGGLYRWRSKTDEHLDRREEGLVILVGLRLTAALALLALAVFVFAPAQLAWCQMGLPSAIRWLGLVLAAISGLFKWWTFAALGSNLTDTVVTREEHSLVTHGPYAYVRHPFYVSFAVDVIAIGLLTDRWIIWLLGAIAVGMLTFRTHREEENLRERFGEEYERYCRRVHAYLPTWRRTT